MRQVAFDVREVRFLKFGRTGSKVWAYFAQTSLGKSP